MTRFRKTGKAVEIDGKPVTGEASFKAKKADGTVNVTFTFDASSLGGHELVVFEKLFLAEIEDGSPVATHEDINDEAQTVSVKELPKDAPEVSSPVQTGDDSPSLMYVTLAGAALLVTIAIGYYYYKNRKKDKKKH